MPTQTQKEKHQERIQILRKCFDYNPIQARELAGKIGSDEDFLEIFEGAKGIFKETKPRWKVKDFYGRHYTIKDGKLSMESSWSKIKKNILECLYSDQGKKVQDILGFLLDHNGVADFPVLKTKFGKVRNALDLLLAYGILTKDESNKQIHYRIYEETAPLIQEVLSSEELKFQEPTTIKSDAAREELDEVRKLDKEFEEYLTDLLDNRLEETVEFGKKMSIGYIADYLEEMFGSILYFDTLLAITQQYGLADVMVTNPEGRIAMQTGFNLAFFGSPGTGKTFAIDDMMKGDKRKNVEAHGLPGRNRYCGGMTAARFIRIGEAYQGRKFNFIIPEFNDWFKYKGMVEPLKLAMEQRDIKYEIKNEVVGPYKFNSFFSTNYNTKTLELGYKVTVSDPNFNAIEDRMLCSLHKMTKERYKEIARSQRDLALGKIKMDKAKQIRDHLTLVYAIETQHKALKDKFPPKNILLTEGIYGKIEDARREILSALSELHKKVIPFSSRLERRAIQLACAMSLPSYFRGDGEHIAIEKNALNFAIKFFVEEASIRSQEEIDPGEILRRL